MQRQSDPPRVHAAHWLPDWGQKTNARSCCNLTLRRYLSTRLATVYSHTRVDERSRCPASLVCGRCSTVKYPARAISPLLPSDNDLDFPGEHTISRRAVRTSAWRHIHLYPAAPAFPRASSASALSLSPTWRLLRDRRSFHMAILQLNLPCALRLTSR